MDKVIDAEQGSLFPNSTTGAAPDGNREYSARSGLGSGLSGSGLELLHQASKGCPRQTGNVLHTALRLAVPKGLNHLPDDLIQTAIEALR